MSLVYAAALALSQVPPGAVKVALDRPVQVILTSRALPYQGGTVSIVSLAEATFVREDVRLRLEQSPPQVTPPGVYGVRWGHLPPVIEPQPPFLLQIHKDPFLRATVKASVAQYNDSTYVVSCAVFDKSGTMLGAASHTEKVSYVRVGSMPTVFREFVFDFGSSRAYGRAAYAVFSVSDPEVELPPDGGGVSHGKS